MSGPSRFVRGALSKIRGYHGSPHDFDKFDSSKIGTGEGAQLFGHGMYIAENPEVAKRYRDDVTAAKSSKAELIAKEHLDFVKDRQKALEYLSGRVENYPGDFRLGELEDARKAVDLLKGDWQPNKGRMYEVDINADPRALLDWDKNVQQQTPEVLERLRGLPYFDQLEEDNLKGASLYRRLGDYLELEDDAVSNSATPSQYAAKELNDLGIPGIKYLDQFSRASGQGTSNYVVFDSKLIEILRKYGLLPLATGLGFAGDGEDDVR